MVTGDIPKKELESESGEGLASSPETASVAEEPKSIVEPKSETETSEVKFDYEAEKAKIEARYKERKEALDEEEQKIFTNHKVMTKALSSKEEDNPEFEIATALNAKGDEIIKERKDALADLEDKRKKEQIGKVEEVLKRIEQI